MSKVKKTKKEAAQAHLSLHLSKCHIAGNHMSRLNYFCIMHYYYNPIKYFLYTKCSYFVADKKSLINLHQYSISRHKEVFSIKSLNAPITTKVIGFSRPLKCLRSLYGKQCGPRSDSSFWSSLFWVHAVCFHT